MAKDFPPYIDYPKPRKPITNADRIRSMTDEELADFLQDVAMQGGIELGGRLTTWHDWLKQEAGQDAGDGS